MAIHKYKIISMAVAHAVTAVTNCVILHLPYISLRSLSHTSKRETKVSYTTSSCTSVMAILMTATMVPVLIVWTWPTCHSEDVTETV